MYWSPILASRRPLCACYYHRSHDFCRPVLLEKEARRRAVGRCMVVWIPRTPNAACWAHIHQGEHRLEAFTHIIPLNTMSTSAASTMGRLAARPLPRQTLRQNGRPALKRPPALIRTHKTRHRSRLPTALRRRLYRIRRNAHRDGGHRAGLQRRAEPRTHPALVPRPETGETQTVLAEETEIRRCPSCSGGTEQPGGLPAACCSDVRCGGKDPASPRGEDNPP